MKFIQYLKELTEAFIKDEDRFLEKIDSESQYSLGRKSAFEMILEVIKEEEKKDLKK